MCSPGGEHHEGGEHREASTTANGRGQGLAAPLTAHALWARPGDGGPALDRAPRRGPPGRPPEPP
eukprot:10203828-Heterocapsa_arctica.AAC.1